MEKGGVTKHTGFCHTAFAAERGVSELCRAVRAAGRIICDRFFAVGALSDFLWRSFREEVIDLLDGDKEDESNDQKSMTAFRNSPYAMTGTPSSFASASVETGVSLRGMKRLEKSIPPRR